MVQKGIAEKKRCAAIAQPALPLGLLRELGRSLAKVTAVSEDDYPRTDCLHLTALPLGKTDYVCNFWKFHAHI